ncbi:MAG: secretin and TonB N-terminal domain-containing protein [Phycisphaerales bacterium]|nr:secretin and TonB N-terminal domain-containing protein [Phycisphaerales bacterium]
MTTRSIAMLILALALPAYGQDVGEDTPNDPDTQLGAGEAAVLAPVGDAGSLGDDGVDVNRFGTVDLNVRAVDIGEVLRMLGDGAGRNIVFGSEVAGTVTTSLRDVTLDEALTAILKVNGYGHVSEGNFIYVYPLETIAQMEQASRQRVERIIPLYYLQGAEAARIAEPMLSGVGQVISLGDVEEGYDPDTQSGGVDSYAFAAKLVVFDYSENIDRIEGVIRELDVSPKQVLVEGTILSAAVSEDNAFGIDMSFIVNPMDAIDYVNPINLVDDILNPGVFNPNQTHTTAGQSTVGQVGEAAGFKIGLLQDNFHFFLRALDEVTDTTVIARPKVLCLNRQKAEILVGERVGYLTTTQTDTATTQTVEFLDTGTHLVFRPYISPNDMIRMELYPRLSSATVTPVTTPTGQPITIPNENTTEVFTNVRVRDGETIVLGGLFQESTAITRRNVPLLGDIPLAGNAFKGQDDQVGREEVIFLLTPTIVKDDRLAEMGDDSLEIMDSVRVGARSGLLPWSREQVTANFNRDALKAFREGELDLAMYYADSSLRHNAQQPELRQLRESLTGEADRTWERHLGRRIMEREMLRGPAPGDFPDTPEDASSDAASPSPGTMRDRLSTVPFGSSGF